MGPVPVARIKTDLDLPARVDDLRGCHILPRRVVY